MEKTWNCVFEFLWELDLYKGLRVRFTDFISFVLNIL